MEQERKPILIHMGRRIYELKEREEFYIMKGQESRMINKLSKNFRLGIVYFPLEEEE